MMGMSNHAKQRVLTVGTIDRPTRIENFMPTMLGISLGEHHKFNIARIPIEILKSLYQIVNFIFRKRKPQLFVGFT